MFHLTAVFYCGLSLFTSAPGQWMKDAVLSAVNRPKRENYHLRYSVTYGRIRKAAL